ncbi:HD domain-containing protein [Candidatus Nomurabacteria bacterium]|nr:HD domain-containing protein [Candidatus Nomurabacteria bacterium]
MKKTTNKALDSIYKFMTDNYQGNWSYRWGGVPWMQKNVKAGKNESILAHQWACVGFWLTLRDICPALAKLVNTQEIYERVWSHDMGETFIGDISQFRQINGHGKDKHILEQEEIQRITKFIPSKTSRKLRAYFKEFEKPIEKIVKLEALVSKFIDTIQGNHFALVFAEGLGNSKNKDFVKKIVERTTVRTANQLLKVLKEGRHIKAYKEVSAVVDHHLDYYRKLGIKIDPDAYSK